MNELNNENTLRILIIGDCKVGKTSLLLKYLLNNNYDSESNYTSNSDSYNNESCNKMNDSKLDFLYTYKPTTLSIYKCQVKINSNVFNILFTDPNGNNQNEKFSELRKHFYLYENNVDVILLCFSLVDRTSFLNITKQWYSEIRQYFNEVPLLLVGTKYDLKLQQKQINNLTDSVKNITNKSKIAILRVNESKQSKLSLYNKTINDNNDTIRKLVNENMKTTSTSITTINDNEFVENTLNVFDTILDEKLKASNESKEIDVNNNQINENPIRRKDCLKLKKLLNAKKYLQCTCYNDKSVQKVMNCAIKYAYNYSKEKLITNENLLPKISYLSTNVYFNKNEPNINNFRQSFSNYNNVDNNFEKSNNKMVKNIYGYPLNKGANSTSDNNNNNNNNMKPNIVGCFCCKNRSETCDSIYQVK